MVVQKSHMITEIGEKVLLASGKKNTICIGSPVYRKISIDKIEILDDSDFFSHGDFLFRLMVDGLDAGISSVKYLDTGDTGNYEFKLVVKHFPFNAAGEPNPLTIEFRVDDLERFGKNETIARFKRTHTEDDRYGISIAPEPMENSYLKVLYSIDEITKSEFEEFERIKGTIFFLENNILKPSSNANIRIFNVVRSNIPPFNSDSGADDGKFIKSDSSDSNGTYTISDLDVDCVYKIRVSAPGLADICHEFSMLHQFINIATDKIHIAGKMVDDTGNPIPGVKIRLYKTMVNVPKKLKCFYKPDTKKNYKVIKGSTAFKLDAGTYQVHKISVVAGNQWAQIQSASIPSTGMGWICYRTGSNDYATINVAKTELTLTKKLKCFNTPNPSDVISSPNMEDVTVKPGNYEVRELKISSNRRNPDFALIESQNLPYDQAWICIRWRSGSTDNFTGYLYDEKVSDSAATSDQKGNITIGTTLKDKVLYRLRTYCRDYWDKISERMAPTLCKDNNVFTLTLKKLIDGMEETQITGLLPDWYGYKYAYPVRYPYSALAGFSVTQASSSAQKKTVCCPFIEGIVVKAWDNSHASFIWDSTKHDQFMVSDVRNDKYSPITALIEKGIAEEVDSDEVPPDWTVVQGWKDDPNKTNSSGNYVYTIPPNTNLPSGHTYIIITVHEGTGRVLTLEATNYSTHDGPCHRKLGDLGSYTPGADWWNNENLWTWERIKNNHKFRRMARLKVNNIHWVW